MKANTLLNKQGAGPMEFEGGPRGSSVPENLSSPNGERSHRP
jgi:hypothetical protein